jgi:hypothetical protein
LILPLIFSYEIFFNIILSQICKHVYDEINCLFTHPKKSFNVRSICLSSGVIAVSLVALNCHDTESKVGHFIPYKTFKMGTLVKLLMKVSNGQCVLIFQLSLSFQDLKDKKRWQKDIFSSIV